MNRTDTDTLLRTLDVADPHVDPRSPRARAAMQRIVQTDPDARPDVRTARPRARRLALAAGAVAALAAGAVVVPSLVGGGDAAYATWTATPTEATVVQRADAGEACRDALARSIAPADADALAGASVAVAEQRGTWTTVVLAGDGGFGGLCVDDGSAGLFDSMFGSAGVAAVPAPSARGVVVTDLGTGSTSAGDLSLVAGSVGDEVTGVRLRTAGVGDVDASVRDGRFVLWFPGDELRDANAQGVELDVTYADGSTGAVTVGL
ncbi:hypothetical protein [Cellulomonas sp. FA1]|uniref:hypothetical protein n=1 Tax=Cellulomonas sp. FA1 TaxID=1346710 RepID=UPI00062668ED|nr:hypothetical protein [Cellulomonas sp. FA1]